MFSILLVLLRFICQTRSQAQQAYGQPLQVECPRIITIEPRRSPGLPIRITRHIRWIPLTNIRIRPIDRPRNLATLRRCIFLANSLSRPLRTHTSPPLPIRPTAPILPDICIPALPRNLRRRTTPYPRLAEEHHGVVERGFREAEAVEEFLGREEQGVGLRGYGDVVRGWDAVCGEFGGLADVWWKNRKLARRWG